MFNVSMFNVDLRPREGEILSARGKLFCRARPPSVSFISTLQRYDILIAVHESSAQKYSVTVKILALPLLSVLLYIYIYKYIDILLHHHTLVFLTVTLYHCINLLSFP